MAQHTPSSHKTETGTKSKPASTPVQTAQGSDVASLIQRAQADPGSLTPGDVMALQRSVGNRTTAGLLRPVVQMQGLRVGPANDRYEQEADRVARQVVNRVQTPPVQREGEAEDELQMKPLTPTVTPLQRKSFQKPVQRESGDEEELQMKPLTPTVTPLQRKSFQKPVQRAVNHGAEGGEVEAGVAQQIQRAGGGGKPLDEKVRGQMERGFGADFSGVRVHTGAQADTLNRSLNARAFTTGKDIFFKRGEYNPGSSGGQKLLAHELTHTVQQGAAGVQREMLQRDPEDDSALDQLTSLQVEQVKNAAFQVRLQLANDFHWKEVWAGNDMKKRPDIHPLRTLIENLPIPELHPIKQQYGRFFFAIELLLNDSSIGKFTEGFSGPNGNKIRNRAVESVKAGRENDKEMAGSHRLDKQAYISEGGIGNYIKAKMSRGRVMGTIKNYQSAKAALAKQLMSDVAGSLAFRNLQNQYDTLRDRLNEAGISVRSSEVRGAFENQQKQARQQAINNLPQQDGSEIGKRRKRMFVAPKIEATERSLMDTFQKYKAYEVARQLEAKAEGFTPLSAIEQEREQEVRAYAKEIAERSNR